jgi:hypothetical protein
MEESKDFVLSLNRNKSQQQTADEKTHRISIRMYFDDFEKLLKFRNYKILEEKDRDFNFTRAISEGINLLNEKYNIQRGREKVKLKKGRRFETSSMEIKDSTINLPQDDIDFINDFIYFMMYEKGNIEYTRMEFFKELVSEIEKKYNI